MNKKLFSAMMFGALLLGSASTFVSCKDYDDDIQDLQEQINKLASKDELSAQISTLQAALNSAASSANDAIAKATAAETAAKAAGDTAAAAQAASDKAAAEAKAAAIAAVQDELDATKTELQDLVAKGLEDNTAEMAKMTAKVDEATKKVENIVGEIADMVTIVELIGSYTATNSTSLYTPVGLSTAIEKDNVFGSGLTNAMTFVKGAQVQTPASFLIRVSPANAVLTPDMISLVNSKGENLDDVMEVVKVEKSDVLLSRAATNSGVWKVTVQLKNYNANAFAAATTTKTGSTTQNILFAVQVNNTKTAAADRYASTSYDLAFDWTAYAGANKLCFFVNEKNVAEVNNRYANNSLSLFDQTGTPKTEYKWNTSTPAVAAVTTGTGVNVIADTGDNRSAKPVYPAVQGQAIKIALTTADTDTKATAPTNIKAIYVTLDKDNAIESAPSELNAWNSYSYTGLNEVVEGTSTEITINASTAINDMIGFRVFAVNFDGTLVDPDGRAFYVNVGNAATSWNAVATTVVPQNINVTAVTATKSDKKAVTLTKLTGADQATWTTDKVATALGATTTTTDAFRAIFVDANGTTVFDTNALTTIPTDFSKAVKVYTMPKVNDWKLYTDDKAYNGTLTIKNATGHVLATINVTMTKVLPTTLPTGFSVKTAQVKDGIYNCYMIPDSWAATTATEGTMAMTEVFNFGTTAADITAHSPYYEVVFGTSQAGATAGTHAPIKVAGNATLAVGKAYIDNTTKHATEVSYNYGKVSSVKNAEGGYDDVKISATQFETVYNCIYNNTYTWNWATRAQLKAATNNNYTATGAGGAYTLPMPYNTELTYGTNYNTFTDGTNSYTDFDGFIFGTSSKDSEYSAMLSDSYNASLEIQSATLTSDSNGIEEYFAVTVAGGHITGFVATATSSTTNPTADVPSTLTIKAKDMYSHDVVIKVKMTVKQR